MDIFLQLLLIKPNNMNIINIFVCLMVVVILILQLLNVAVSQRAVNITLCIAILLEVIGNSGWLHL